jgi:hypothetical protein
VKRVAIVSATALLLGCQNLDLQHRTFRCGQPIDCLPGMTCDPERAICVPAGTDARASDAANATDRGPAPDAELGADAATADSGLGPDGSSEDATSYGPCLVPAPGTTCDPPRVSASPPPLWSPINFASLVLWLTYEGIISDPSHNVVAWEDASGAHNRAHAWGSAPVLALCSLNLVGGVRFSGTQQLTIPDDLSLQLSGDFVLSAVASYLNQPPTFGEHGYGTIYDKTLPEAPFHGLAMFLNHTPLPSPDTSTITGFLVQLADPLLAANSAVTSSAAFGCNDGRPRAYSVRRTGSLLELFVNGVRVGAAEISSGLDLSAIGAPVLIGSGRVPNSQTLDGTLYELILINGSVGDADLGKLHAYLINRFLL